MKIYRSRIFSHNPRENFWYFVEEFSKLQSPEAEVNTTYMLIASLAMYRGRWQGTLMEWAWVVFDVVLSVVLKLCPSWTRLQRFDGQTSWQLNWLGFIFSWEGKRESLPVLVIPPPDPVYSNGHDWEWGGQSGKNVKLRCGCGAQIYWDDTHNPEAAQKCPPVEKPPTAA